MSSILKTWGSSTCLLCGHTLKWNEKRYCGACHVGRATMITRLENDDDLLRVMVVCTRKGAAVSHHLFVANSAQSLAIAVNARLAPLLDFFTAQVMTGKLTPVMMGVLWVDLSSDLTALYHNLDKRTDVAKTELYNQRMRPKLTKMFGDSLLVLPVSEFRRVRDNGFDFLFPKGQDGAPV